MGVSECMSTWFSEGLFVCVSKISVWVNEGTGMRECSREGLTD